MKKRDTNDSTSQMNLLCLNCRSLGHVVRDCPVQLGQLFPNQHWNYSANRITLLDGLLANANSKLCSRCEKLDILTMFDGELDWMNPQTPLDIADIASSQHYRNLGPVGTVQFRQDCPLCVGLFGLAPTPWSLKEDVHVLADWSIHRLERLVEVGSHPKHCYDKCLVVDLAPKNGQLSLDEHEGDALAILREGGPVSLTPQLVDPALINLSLITEYFEACDRRHSLTCTRRPGSQLKDIKLIDAETRRLVPYPHQECDYLALSYVWGSGSSIVFSGDRSLSTMPATIEDAITLTNLLGKRYLWVDSLCIDQSNEGEKAQQIKLMADIYRGAYATVISLCGTTMDDGLARVSSGRRLAQPQLACEVNGKRLVGLMPTLSRQVAYGQWGSRAWTLQEALLSRRNIYFTDHQVYFECNAMQCSESIDVSKSWVHNSPRGVKQVKSDSEGLIYGHGTLRNAVTGIGKPKDPMMAYGVLVGLYSYRSMSDDHDAINAFSAILDHLQEYVFDNGFYYGLPEDDLNWSLLWCPLDDIERRPGFPAWSWAGWKGAIHPGWPSEVSGPTQQYWTHFCAWRPNGHRQELVFPHHASDSPQHCQRLFEVATVFDVAVKPSLDPKLLRTYGPCKSNSGVLFIDCLVWQKKFKLRKRYEDWDYGPFEHFVVKLNGVTCLFRAPTSTDLGRHTGAGKQTNLILTARDEWQGYIVHHFLDVDINKKGEAFRHGVLALMVPKSHPEALNGIVVSRRSFVLI
ncbi:hypothetical protein LTR70_002554 [Exophiala xenobiotica]|uniref:CCHC-type domain-containing protein n=1 Tax=Lithohypha guttulata TaxID=1690604 RepID=A0ABR0KK14_9EURO|nr:hypothetical protein LTR24_001771 [Lithohypha guttulata]KAK5325388.1 hypothetical protein LTR70_002554 [Exophiala xenobiotica]